MATTFFLLRHAAHDRVGSVLCGRMPGVALSAWGQAQAARLAELLGRASIAAVHTSPLERCRDTAAPLARRLGLQPVVAEEINEIDFGLWTGQGFDILARDPRWRRWNQARDGAEAPGGESMRAAQARAVRHIEASRARHPDAGLAIVSHCDVLKAVLAHYLGLPLQAYERIEIGPASVSLLVTWEGGGKVIGMNDLRAA
jgi:probable phosphoglycerate mutase